MAAAPDEATQAQQLVALLAAQERGQQRLNDLVMAFIRQLIASLQGKGWYNDDQVSTAAARIGAQVKTAQKTVSGLTTAYVDQSYRMQGITPPRDRVALPDMLRPVDPVEEWTRPAKTYRRLVAEGIDTSDAEERAILRAQQMLSADLNLAMRETARQRMEAEPRTLGYRRVLRPELSKYGSCGLCVVAADRIYTVEELLAIHELCKCKPAPIIEGQPDPARFLNELDIKAVYAAAGGTTDGAALKRVKVQIVEHGELGPVLRPADNNVRTLEQVVKDQQRVDPATVLKTSEEVIRKLLERQAAGENVDGPLEYHRKLVERMRGRLSA